MDDDNDRIALLTPAAIENAKALRQIPKLPSDYQIEWYEGGSEHVNRLTDRPLFGADTIEPSTVCVKCGATNLVADTDLCVKCMDYAMEAMR